MFWRYLFKKLISPTKKFRNRVWDFLKWTVLCKCFEIPVNINDFFTRARLDLFFMWHLHNLFSYGKVCSWFWGDVFLSMSSFYVKMFSFSINLLPDSKNISSQCKDRTDQFLHFCEKPIRVTINWCGEKKVSCFWIVYKILVD